MPPLRALHFSYGYSALMRLRHHVAYSAWGSYQGPGFEGYPSSLILA